MKRVVVTGMAGLCPIGQDWPTVLDNLRGLHSGIVSIPEWSEYRGLRTQIAGTVKNFVVPSSYPRQKTRTMGRVALLATRATELALADADLLESPWVKDGSLGISYGSAAGSPSAIAVYGNLLANHCLQGITASNYIQMMSHTCAANLGQFFEIKGRIIPTCSACTAGSQGIGYGYEAIKYGKQRLMVAGGAEELDVVAAAVFDILFATSVRNDRPTSTPRPFDAGRDGLVVGEGAGTLVLEEMEHALARGVRIYAEIVGFGTNCDGHHVTNPSPEGMQRAMELALEDAQLSPVAIGYINAHGTATEMGDIAESVATHRLFGHIPISSLKSYVGHTLGACGALEAWTTIQMMREGWFAPTINLEEIDPRCAALDYLQGEGRSLQIEFAMSNNFAFGGVNTSLIFRRWAGQ